MDLYLNTDKAKGYKSSSQIARVLTEDWVKNNSYCPSCGNQYLTEYANNKPVADFHCIKCKEEFELKSKKGSFTNTITDGAYSKMIERINSEDNPNFFFLTYTEDWMVNNFLIIPKQFFTQDIIVKRPPLASTAKRAGWVGCNIDISNIADIGKIFLVKNSIILNQSDVKEKFNKTTFLKNEDNQKRGWLLDVMSCVSRIKTNEFTLNQVYQYENELKLKHPDNNNIQAKIRQQLQLLRDKGLIEFTKKGHYKKVEI